MRWEGEKDRSIDIGRLNTQKHSLRGFITNLRPNNLRALLTEKRERERQEKTNYYLSLCSILLNSFGAYDKLGLDPEQKEYFTSHFATNFLNNIEKPPKFLPDGKIAATIDPGYQNLCKKIDRKFLFKKPEEEYEVDRDQKSLFKRMSVFLSLTFISDPLLINRLFEAFSKNPKDYQELFLYRPLREHATTYSDARIKGINSQLERYANELILLKPRK